MSVSFGDLVRRGREEAGLSQSRLALLIGKSPTTIRAWEHGRTNPADPRAVAALAAVLGLDETELLDQAGFEAPVTSARRSGREELTKLAAERTEMIALTPSPEAADLIKPVKVAISEPDVVDSRTTIDHVAMNTGTHLEAEVDVEPVITPSIPIPVPPADVPKPRWEFPRPKIITPKTRIVVTQQVPTEASPSGSNGYVAGRSYLEDEDEKDFYRRRGLITAFVLVFMAIVIWWALGRTGGAIGDLIESIVGLLDI